MGSGLGPGHAAYAQEHADMFEALRLDGDTKLRRCGVPTLIDPANGATLAERVKVFRKEEEKHFPQDRSAFLVNLLVDFELLTSVL